MADIKFSEFPKANQSKDSDEIAILQDGVNKMIPSPVLESKIINKTVSRVIDQGGASLNVINLKGVVPTYADLALILPTPELNDAYQVEADGLVYVYTENGFQAEGDGIVVQPEPIGVVEEGNENAVSGDEVYNSISEALDFSDRFKIAELVPDDRSDITFSDYYFTTNYYYEEGNYNGVEKIYIKSNLAGDIDLAIIQPGESTAILIEYITVNVVVGINEFNIQDLGFNDDNLNLEEFVIGVSPSLVNMLGFQTSAEGSLTGMYKNNSTLFKTTHKGCLWAEIKRTPYLVDDYPKTKDLLEKTINKENSFQDLIVPYSKASINYSINGTVGLLYGAEDTFYSLQNGLKDVKIKSVASGFVNFYFVNIEGSELTILHTTQVSCSVGNNTFTAQVLNAPVPINDKKIYILLGNETTQTPNVIQGSGVESPLSRLYFTYQTSNQQLTQTEGQVGFNFWLTVYEPENKLVAEVDRLTEIVDNLPDVNNEESLYDYKTNAPILPCDIFVDEADPTPLFKNSLFQKFVGQNLPSVKLISDNKTFDVQDPTYINHNEVGTLARILIDKYIYPSEIIYKDLNVHKFNSNEKTGSISVMSLGDSLTEGGLGFNSSPIFLLTQQLQNLGITVNGIGTLQRTSSAITQRYEGRGGWRYRTFVGLESQFASLNVVIPNASKNVWIEGTDGNMNTIKANNAFLYEATAQDLIDYPQWCFHFVSGATTNNVRYSENPNLGTYHIFSPARYFSERGISFPDVITIALGTNEWYLGGFSGWDLPLITSCADWMIQRFLDAVPSTTSVIVIPCNNMPLTRENEWQEKASFLTSSVLKIIEEKKLTHSNLYSLSIYAHGSRQLAYNKELSNTYLSTNNSTKVGIIDTDVHILNTDDEGRSDYMNALKTSILYFA